MTSDPPRVDIVVPAHNAERFLPETLDSVRAQTVEDWRLLVVDDASTDGTRRVGEAFAAFDRRIRVKALRENAGASRARNLGFAAGDAPYVTFLDADDCWEPDALEVLLGAIERAPEAPAAHGLARAVDVEGRPSTSWAGTDVLGERRPCVERGRRRYLGPDEPTGFAAFAVCSEIPTPGMVLLRRAALERPGEEPWDGAAFPADDWDLWLRLTRTAPFAFVDRVVLRYRRHEAQATAGAAHRLRAADAYVRLKLLASGLSEEERRLAIDGWRFQWRRLAGIRARWATDALRRGAALQAARQARHAAVAYARSLPWSRWSPEGDLARDAARASALAQRRVNVGFTPPA